VTTPEPAPGQTSTTIAPAVIGGSGEDQGPGGTGADPDPSLGRDLPADPEAQHGPTISVDDPDPAPGDTVAVAVMGVSLDGGPYELVLGGTVVASGLAASPDGRIALTVTIPATLDGVHPLQLRSQAAPGVLAEVPLDIAPPVAPARTVVLIGVGLLSMLVVAAGVRRRRRRAPASVAPMPAPGPESPSPTAPTSEPLTGAEPSIATPFVGAPVVASTPWSNHGLDEAVGDAQIAAIATWHGALWLAASLPDGRVQRAMVMSSLNGITWSDGVVLGTGGSPRILTDHSQICVVAQSPDGGYPSVWMSRDGLEWTELASGGSGQPVGRVTAATSHNGLVLLCCTTGAGSAVWAGRRDGEWIGLDLGMEPSLLANWSGRLMAFGFDGAVPSIAESEAGIRWKPVHVDAPPSFAAFAPSRVVFLESDAFLLGADRADRVADAWVSSDGATWDRAPLDAPTGSSIVAGGIADGGIIAVGNVPDGGAVWRTEDGIRWQRVEDSARFAGLILVDFAHYEGRSHVIALDADGKPGMWVRQPWEPAPQADATPETTTLQLVVDADARVERPA